MTEVRPYPITGPVFTWNWNATAEVVINQGGTSSSKTYSILQVLFLRAAIEPGVVITVVGGDVPDLKSGALRDARNIVNSSDFLRFHINAYNVTERIFSFRSGSVIEFKSYENEYDARSGKRDYCYINEAQNIKKEVYDELQVRTRRQTFIDYNPSQRFWAHDLIGQDGVVLFISNFTHNPLLDEATRRKILRYKKTNPRRWRVFGLGLTGEVEGAIFQDVFACDAFPQVDAGAIRYGMDFGFSNDPTTLVRVGKLGDCLYGEQLLYESGLSNAAIVERLRRLKIPQSSRIMADSADPKAIKYIQESGFNIHAAKKGPDSVRFGIEQIKSYEGGVHLCGEATEWWVEQENYKWTKKNGKYINIPVSGFDHLWDAFRYAVSDISKRVIMARG